MSVAYRVECIDCGWSTERDKRASNLPAENNERITRIVGDAHENSPRFGDRADETHRVRFIKVADVGAKEGGD